jgi:uncharacterized surface protein with fasciclin (FAS1) repeats
VHKRAEELEKKLKEEFNKERSTVSSYRYIISAPEFETFAILVKASSWAKAFHNNSITVFAPNEEAFESIGMDKVKALAKNSDTSKIDAFVGAHACTTQVTAEKIDKIEGLADLNGDRLIFNEKGSLTVNDIAAVRYDINTGNGNIIEMKGLLAPID